MASYVEVLAKELKSLGNTLTKPPDSIDKLLYLLDVADNHLSMVDQAPSDLVNNSLIPLKNALINKELLRHSNMSVKISTLCCITEITRITAPDAPFEDELMKEVFQLTVTAFDKLSQIGGPCYLKVVSILENVSKVRSSMVMLDLECDDLILQMFQTFFKVIQSNHPNKVSSSMEAIMAITLDEIEEISQELLMSLLDSVRKENQKVSPASWKLGDKVIEICADTLKPYLISAMESNSIVISDYSQRIISICEHEPDILKSDVKGFDEHVVVGGLIPDSVCIETDHTPKIETIDDYQSPEALKPFQPTNMSEVTENPNTLELINLEKSEFKAECIPRKRDRKPNRLMNPDEGYDIPCIDSGKRSRKINMHKRKKEPVSKEAPHLSIGYEKNSLAIIEQMPMNDIKDSFPEKSFTKTVRQRKKTDSVNQKTGQNPKLKNQNPAVISSNHDPDDDKIVAKGIKEIGWQINGILDLNTEENVATTPAEVNMVKQNQSDMLPSSEKESKPQSVKLEETSTLDIDLLVPAASKKRRKMVKSFEKEATEEFGIKNMDSKTAPSSSKEDEIHLDGSPIIKAKRKRTMAKEENFGVFNDVRDLGSDLIGRMIKVWWPMDKRFYKGIVSGYNDLKKRHQVLYKDGDEELLNLNKQRWELIENDTSEDEQEETPVFSCPNASSNVRKRKKSNTKLHDLAKKTKANSSTTSTAPSRKSVGDNKICVQI